MATVTRQVFVIAARLRQEQELNLTEAVWSGMHATAFIWQAAEFNADIQRLIRNGALREFHLVWILPGAAVEENVIARFLDAGIAVVEVVEQPEQETPVSERQAAFQAQKPVKHCLKGIPATIETEIFPFIGGSRQ